MALASSLDFDEVAAGQVGIVVTELAGNLVKHAGGGDIILRQLHSVSTKGLEVMSLDKGPGIEDVARCLEDGYSTAGSPGTGMGAVGRLSGSMDIYSQIGKGTAIMAPVWAKPLRKPEPQHVGALCIAVGGESECGDGWALLRVDNKIRIIATDGLGHGPLAAKATEYALEIFQEYQSLAPAQLIAELHKALLSTRGAAIATAEIYLDKQEMKFAGVGNISGAIISGLKLKGLASYNGTVGHQMYKVQEITYNCPANSIVILHSDGLTNRWRLEDYPGLNHRHPSLIAGVLYRDFQRGRDDATVLALSTV